MFSWFGDAESRFPERKQAEGESRPPVHGRA